MRLHEQFSVPNCSDMKTAYIDYQNNQNYFGLRYQNILGPKNYRRKCGKIYNAFELCQVLICPIMFWYLLIISSQCLLKTFLPLPTRFCYLQTWSCTKIFVISENWFYFFFFFIFWHAPVPLSYRMPYLFNKNYSSNNIEK